MTERATKDKPRITKWRHGWQALSAWDTCRDDDVTWRLNIKAFEFVKSLNAKGAAHDRP
jgi:hypothetical protein